jgi:xanthine dehydrogenase YagT iron-sulfur-binding subunit
VLDVNGKRFNLLLESRTTLAEALRENLGLYGTKISCNRAECGSCTVLVDGRAVYSCTTLAVEVSGSKIRTIEGLADEASGKLHPLQERFIREDALQCGYCTPGIIMALMSLLGPDGERPRPGVTSDTIRSTIAGNYCRCGAYPNIEKVASDILISGGRETH